MKICFYAPFKPLGHPNPSGDLIIATGLFDFLKQRGHEVMVASSFRSRWIYWKPWLLPQLLLERYKTKQRVRRFRPDLWLSYHCYYKAPDILGPGICRTEKIPYTIFQGIYSTKRRRKVKTAPGFYLNRKSLLQAAHCFTNRKVDHLNLERIIASDKLSYIKPGIFPEQFQFRAAARKKLRQSWRVGDTPVIVSAAMFRPDVKTQGLSWLIRSLGTLAEKQTAFHLVIAGDGSERQVLEKLGERYLPGRVRFVGKIARQKMEEFYSAGDIFAFPGIRESLGMVYLEAQSCTLPVIAFDNGGIPEVVIQDKTALLCAPFDEEAFCNSIQRLLDNQQLRTSMGEAAAEHVRRNHDLHSNYLQFEELLLKHAQTFTNKQV